VEVVLFKLNENREEFERFASDFPFIITTDFQQWESPVVQGYYVYETPALYLLDNERKLLLRPKSAEHMDSWVDWNFVRGNE